MDDQFNIDCSDDELKTNNGHWEPDPEEITRLYDLLDKNGTLELNWKCPGYRSPSPEPTDEPSEDTETKPTDDKDDFDFMDEAATPKLKMRKGGEETPKGSAKKKTTSLDGVINNMRRHKLIPSQNQES